MRDEHQERVAAGLARDSHVERSKRDHEKDLLVFAKITPWSPNKRSSMWGRVKSTNSRVRSPEEKVIIARMPGFSALQLHRCLEITLPR